MKKHIPTPALLFLLLLLVSSLANAQMQAVYGRQSADKTFGRITIGDTLTFDGHIELPRTFPEEISVKRPGGTFETYKAGEVTAFTFIDNQTFKAFPIEEGDETAGYFFAEELSRGNVTLYSSKLENHRFFYTDQKGSHRIDRQNYRRIIDELAGPCEEFQCRHKKTMLTTKSLTFFFDRYNTGKLNTYFPMMSAGFILQYNITRWTLPPINQQKFENTDLTLTTNYFSPGLFFHLPLFTPRRMGIDLKMTHHSHTLLFHESVLDVNGYISDIKVDMSYLNTDIGVKYSLMWRRFEPYFSGGISYYQHLQYNSQLHFINISNNIYTYDIFKDILPQPGILIGYYFSQGLQYSILPRTFLAAEWGYTSMSNVTGPQYAIKNLQINFKVNFWPW